MNQNTTIFSQNDIISSWNLLKKARTITLLTHHKPDGDGMSACAALEMVLLSIDSTKRIETIYPTTAESDVLFPPKNVLINQRLFTPDVVVALDTANYDRLYYPEAFKKIPLINIDHHISNALQGIHNFVDARAGSTCEVLYNLFMLWCPDEITKDVASALLFGILYDTQTFQTQSTTNATLKIAAALLDKGVDLFAIRNAVVKPKDYATVQFWGILLSSLKRTQSGKAVWIAITVQELSRHHLNSEHLYGFNNFLANLIDADVIAILTETEEKTTKISLRSRRSDVNALAHHFGGGGHKNAAGALCLQPIEHVEAQLQKLLEAL